MKTTNILSVLFLTTLALFFGLNACEKKEFHEPTETQPVLKGESDVSLDKVK
jgi:hypothetical protein